MQEFKKLKFSTLFDPPKEEERSCLLNCSNDRLLKLSAGLFFLFVMAEFGGAYYSGSLGLFGDASAMTVDVVTYIGNMLAENVKGNFLYSLSPRRKFFLKVLAPSFAVVTLSVITIMIVREAVIVLLFPPAENNVDSNIMYAFAGVNVVIDVVCVIAFCTRGRDVFYESKFVPQLSLDTDVHSEGSDDFGHLDDDLEPPGMLISASASSSHHASSSAIGEFIRSKLESVGLGLLSRILAFCCCPASAIAQHFHKQSRDEKNLNMISAFTHIGGDTLRTISVFIAAVVSTSTGINADLCDAWAAIAVSVTIVMIMYPLAEDIGREIWVAWHYGWDADDDSRPGFEYDAVSVDGDDGDFEAQHGSSRAVQMVDIHQNKDIKGSVANRDNDYRSKMLSPDSLDQEGDSVKLLF